MITTGFLPCLSVILRQLVGKPARTSFTREVAPVVNGKQMRDRLGTSLGEQLGYGTQ